MMRKPSHWILFLITLLYVGWNVYLFAETNTKVVPDSSQYHYVATLPILSTDFWFDWRPTTTPLLFKIFGNDNSRIIYGQFAIAIVSWLVLASGTWVSIRHEKLKLVGYAGVLFVGTATDFVLVVRSISTEGVAYSLTALVIGAWLWTVHYLREHPNLSFQRVLTVSAGLMASIFFWSVSRYPHAFVLIGSIAILSLLLVVSWRKLEKWRIVLPIIIVGSIATFFFQSIPVSHSDYWKQGFMNALAEKVLPYPDRTEFLVERGMPSGPEAMKYAGYVPARYAGEWEPIFDDWLENGGARKAYFVDYLVLNPIPRLGELGKNWDKIFNPNISVWYFSRLTPNGDLNQWQADTHYLYYDPSSTLYIVGILVGLLLFALVFAKTRRLEGRYLVALVVLALILPAAYMNWFGDAYYERVFIGVSLQLKIGALLLGLFIVDTWLTQKEQFSKNLPIRILSGVLLVLACVEVLFGLAILRNNVTYPVLSKIAPHTNFFHYWDVSDLEYEIYQDAPIGEPVMSLQQNIIDGNIYYREYMVYWSEGGAHGELRDDSPDDPIELAWRNTPVSYDTASPAGPVFGGYAFDEQRGAALKQWELTRLPANLTDVGIHYLQVDTAVWDTLPPFQVGVLQNPNFYQLVSEWEDDAHTAPQHLYRIVGNVRDWTLPESLANAPLGLSDEHYTAYQDQTFTLVDDDALIFNPASGEEFSRQTEVNRLAAIISYTNPAGGTLTSLFELLNVFEHMQFDADLTAEQQTALNNWRSTKQPDALREAGIDYLFFESTWAGWLTDEERAMLSDPANYQVVNEWFGSTPNRYFLIRVLAP